MTEPPRADDLCEFLRANATLVAPDETLIIQVSEQLTPQQVREYQEYLNWAHEDGTLPFRSLVVPGTGLGRVAQGPLMAALRAVVREEVAVRL